LRYQQKEHDESEKQLPPQTKKIEGLRIHSNNSRASHREQGVGQEWGAETKGLNEPKKERSTHQKKKWKPKQNVGEAGCLLQSRKTEKFVRARDGKGIMGGYNPIKQEKAKTCPMRA